MISLKIEIGRPGKRWTVKWIFGTSHVASSLIKVLRRNIILVDKWTKASVYTHHRQQLLKL
jgi:hypothetical protein